MILMLRVVLLMVIVFNLLIAYQVTYSTQNGHFELGLFLIISGVTSTVPY